MILHLYALFAQFFGIDRSLQSFLAELSARNPSIWTLLELLDSGVEFEGFGAVFRIETTQTLRSMFLGVISKLTETFPQMNLAIDVPTTVDELFGICVDEDISDRVNIIYAGFWSRLEISPQITSLVINVSGVLKIIVITLLGDGLTTLLRETEIKFKYLRKPSFLRRGRLRRRFILKDEAV